MRYFIEISYKGTAYSGFQEQHNANTIQAEVEKALEIYFKKEFQLTGSSRTDAGVHALQNYFHFDSDQALTGKRSVDEPHTSQLSSPGGELEEAVYHLNAILPRDIVIKRIFPVGDEAHCRFDALWREYKYFIYSHKNPFLQDRAFYFPYKIDKEALAQCAALIKNHCDFTSFSKRNTQVKTFICEIQKSEWSDEGEMLVYTVRSNRFLRGMVKALVGTMLRAATGKISVAEFEEIINSRDCTKAEFSVSPHGLFLVEVKFDKV
ncbi:MAG TPA: tRNA pseudouridine(38-40) synthase TruA [Hanamia sp.]|nr:tRNA pseudouridine(38-40) synthase TruA [Hanamia sp.]